jgi:hypothetical protein
MALTTLLPMVGGAASQGLGVLLGLKNQRRTNQAYGIPDNFGKTPDVDPNSYTPLTRNLPDETAGQVQNTLRQGAASIPGFSLSTAQQTANQAALDAQKPYANEAIDLARNSSAGAADQFVKGQLQGGPEAISQLTFDRMAAQLSENAAAAARNRNTAAQGWAAGSIPSCRRASSPFPSCCPLPTLPTVSAKPTSILLIWIPSVKT